MNYYLFPSKQTKVPNVGICNMQRLYRVLGSYFGFTESEMWIYCDEGLILSDCQSHEYDEAYV